MLHAVRTLTMRFAHALLAISALVTLAACGGSGGGKSGEGQISGVVFDSSGVVVRNATVSYDANHQTTSNEYGIYVLNGIPERDVVVHADLIKDGIHYEGQNLASVTANQRIKDVNVAIYPSNELAAIHGTIRDRQGRLLSGVRVFLVPTDGSLPTSSVGITNGDGEYRVGGLHAGLTYQAQVNALGYGSDFETITLSSGEDRYVEFTGQDSAGTGVGVPTGLTATAFTTPPLDRANSQATSGYETIKRILDPRRAKLRTARTTLGGGEIEVELFWDLPAAADQSELLGYGIYRSSNGSPFENTDFLRDPQAIYFADLDSRLIEQRTYKYAITGLDVLYDGNQGESSLSAPASVTPLGDMSAPTITASSHPTIRWSPALGATQYQVYIFDEYPSLYVEERTHLSNPVTGTSYTYPGTLSSGTHYYAVVGENSDGTAFTISRINSFNVP